MTFSEFAGQAHEDPGKFMRTCRDRQTRFAVPLNEWTERVSERLRGSALDWWGMIGEFQMEWDDFVVRFEGRFDGAREHAQYQRTLFYHPQAADEDVETFIRNIVRLHRRLVPGGHIGAALGVVVELMVPELWPFLRSANGRGLEDFVQLAKEVDHDLRSLRRQRSSPAQRRGTYIAELTTPEDALAVVS
ncbi:activity-regulated cytoskeleton-associated protein-like [Bacillus rossius redtenbacheri]|uniref:activity-regulated cytoskeleton-associated protein-like n=1 Tax=Bacillus rossius redtenbacheri TaxID=93214 RepID=UPI002FDE475F